jgi:hypothetical protein
MSIRKNIVGMSGVNSIQEGFLSIADMTRNQFGLVQAVSTNGEFTVGNVTGTANTTCVYPIGIQQNEPLSGTGAEIRVTLHGVAKARVNAACTAGAFLSQATNTAWLTPAASGASVIIGFALESAAAASETIAVFITNPGTALR